MPVVQHATVMSVLLYGGTKDLRRHEQTAVHQTAQKSSSGVTSLAPFKPTKQMLERCRNVMCHHYLIQNNHMATLTDKFFIFF